MVFLPAFSAVVSIAFASALFLRFRGDRKAYHLAWGISMTAFAVASLAVAAGMSGGWDPTLYRIFWLFGALLNVPWLATGSIALVAKRHVTIAAFAASTVGTAFAIFAVARDPVMSSAFPTDAIPSSGQAWGDASPQPSLLTFYSIIPYLIVVAIAGWTSRTRKGLRPPAGRVRGNALIAFGVTVVAVGGFALRRLDDSGAAFSVALAAGVTMMFAGFLAAARAPRYTVTDPGESPT